ncbi:MAG: hypothetical protein FJ145_06475 [Deltaproteobacteria bacterium]|nr:hypothetical protein [Deltaproteobacteria bacterium]
MENLKSKIIDSPAPAAPHATATSRRLHYRAPRGVPHYWLFNPDLRGLEAYELNETRYTLATSLKDASEYRPGLFPGLTIPLASIWPCDRSR